MISDIFDTNEYQILKTDNKYFFQTVGLQCHAAALFDHNKCKKDVLFHENLFKQLFALYISSLKPPFNMQYNLFTIMVQQLHTIFEIQFTILCNVSDKVCNITQFAEKLLKY